MEATRRQTSNGRRLRVWAGMLLAWTAVIIGPALKQADAIDDSRIDQVRRRIEATRVVLTRATNELEQVRWQQRLDLLELELKNLEFRAALDEREDALAVEQQRDRSLALIECLRADINFAYPTERHIPTTAPGALRVTVDQGTESSGPKPM